MGARAKVGVARLGLLLCAVVAMLTVTSGASADFVVCSPGTTAGHCSLPQGVAVDFESGRVYVADKGNSRIDVFKSDGTPLFSFEGGFASPSWVAVDNGGASPSHHDIYVIDGHQVKKFDPTGAKLKEWGSQGFGPGQLEEVKGIGVTAAGVVYVADSKNLGNCEGLPGNGSVFSRRVQKFSEAGELVGTVEPSLDPCSPISAFAVDSVGNFYLGNQEPNRALRKYDPSGTNLYTIEPNVGERALAVDDSDNLFAAQDRGFRVIAKYDPNGNRLRRYGYGAITKNVVGLAPHHTAAGDVYLSEEVFSVGDIGQVKYLTEPPPGPVIAPPSVEAKSVGNTKATLRAEVNPEGKATSFQFEYVDDAAFKASGFATAKSTTLTPLDGEADFELHVASVQVGCTDPVTEAAEGKCLTPETVYHFRVKVGNEDGTGNAPVEGPTFKTEPPLKIETTYSSEVGTDSARLSAKVNPLGIPASGYFEYVDDATYQQSGFAEATQVPGGGGELDFGSGEAGVTRSVSLSLAAATTYHYRILAINQLIAPKQAIGPERILTTFAKEASHSPCPANEAFRGGASAFLPDCRAYELVSPLDKENGDIIALHDLTDKRPATFNQSAADGERLAYGSSRAFGDAVAAPYTSQYIAARGEEGWTSHAISPPRSHSNLIIAAGLEPELMALSPDLCQTWWHIWSDPKLAPGAVEGFPNLYRRQDSECGGSGWEAITTVRPPHEVVFRAMETQGISADGSRAIYVAEDNLAAGAPDLSKASSRLALYYQDAGEGPPHYVCVLPSGEAIEGACAAGYTLVVGSGRSALLQGALSADGSRVFWTALSGFVGPGQIYLRENPDQPESAHLHGEAKGTGDLIGPAQCTGNLGKTLTTVKKVKCASGTFGVGQEVSASEGIQPGTTITKIEEPEAEVFTLTLSKAATLTKTGSELVGIASEVVSNVVTSSGAFAVGQEISAPGGAIPAETTIAKLEEAKPGVFRLTLSAKAAKTKAGSALASSSECTEADKACTIAVSRQAEKLSGTVKSQFAAAAADGSAAIFTTVDNGKGTSDLYRFDVASKTTTLVAHKATVMGASEDLSSVYLTSDEVLTSANAEGREPIKGKANLYLDREGTLHFVVTLGSTGEAEPVPRQSTSRVSADGSHAVFMSTSSLTGYDNTDAKNGEADSEVFLYDAAANGGGGELLCVSCSPTGARPVGWEPNSLYAVGPFHHVAGQIPPSGGNLYSIRILSEDGNRLYFESNDALTRRDSNGVMDVYQWEAPGTGGCEEGAFDYSEANQGCIDLISSGQSPRESEIVDTSPDGQDVFFATLSSLLPQDEDLVDIYDARIGGGFPSPAGLPPSCEGEACQPAPEAPNDSTPASATFEGAGNVREEAAKPKACVKGKVRRHGKCVAKKRKRTHKHRHNGRTTR